MNQPTNQKSVQTAVQEIALIRQLIDHAGKREESIPVQVSAIDASMAFQGIALAITAFMAGVEVFSTTSMTRAMLAARTEQDLGIMGLGFIGATLATVLLCIYFLIWRSAKSETAGFVDYVNRNFRYLRNLSFLSDLIAKAAPLALLVLAGKTEWITPLCVLFVGSSLIEGKFFHLPLKSTLSLGASIMVGAMALYYQHVTSLLFPLGVFGVCTALSIAHLYNQKRQLTDQTDQKE